ncbi:DUF4142 domain-containing protein [Mesorhizobium sp. SP-1A]|uniref:DUF4142 domain-containing protein n=1 Tax=Mesorhizobium sp. SP-1A TaxID=3077840 RepID=UPI0028F71A3A|nr:DUF4142 domain-containing protein [Mesorhizobium sp. SP-1A]
MRKLLAIAAAALLASGSFAFAQSSSSGQSGQTTMPKPSTNSMSDTSVVTGAKVDTPTFIKTVPSANEFEIRSSEMALKKASGADVKKFARQMVKDHTKAGKNFKAALKKVESASADANPPLQPKEQQMLDELKGLSGDQFQAKYIEMQTQAHEEAVALFSGYTHSGDNPALKEFAKKTLPTLKMHEKMIKEVGASHKG